MAKLWAGRFSKEVDETVNAFNSSIAFDGRMYKQDITGSIAHATMLGEQGIIAKEEADKIVATLKILLEEIEAGKVEFTKDSEDIHMNMEVLLTERIGDVGKRLQRICRSVSVENIVAQRVVVHELHSVRADGTPEERAVWLVVDGVIERVIQREQLVACLDEAVVTGACHIVVGGVDAHYGVVVLAELGERS